MSNADGPQPTTPVVTRTTGLTVRVRPAGLDIEVPDGEDLMSAAQRAGYKWPTICGGQGTCRTCYVEVEAGIDNCSPMRPLEREGIEALKKPLDGATRLACQLAVTGPGVVVLKRGVRERKR